MAQMIFNQDIQNWLVDNQITYSSEIVRKLIHILSIIFAISLILFGRDLILLPLIILSAIFIFFDYTRIKFTWVNNLYNKFFRQITRPNEKYTLTGASFTFIGVTLTILLFSESAAFIGLLFLSMGDSMGALIGRKYGKTRFGRKSIEGSFAFFLSCTLTAILITSIPIIIILCTAIFATFLEAVKLPKLDDNITIPIGSAFLIQIMNGTF